MGPGLSLLFPQRQAGKFLKVFCEDPRTQRGPQAPGGGRPLWSLVPSLLELILAKGIPLSLSPAGKLGANVGLESR